VSVATFFLDFFECLCREIENNDIVVVVVVDYFLVKIGGIIK